MTMPKDRRPIDNKTLHTFVTQKYHWKSLSHEQQMSMAVELMKLRLIVERQLEMLGQTFDAAEAGKLYRELLVKIHDDVCHEHYYTSVSGKAFCIYCGEEDKHE